MYRYFGRHRRQRSGSRISSSSKRRSKCTSDHNSDDTDTCDYRRNFTGVRGGVDIRHVCAVPNYNSRADFTACCWRDFFVMLLLGECTTIMVPLHRKQHCDSSGPFDRHLLM